MQIRSVVNAVQKANGLSPEVGTLLVQEFLSQFSKSLSSGSRINSDEGRIRRPQTTKAPAPPPSCVMPYERTQSSFDPLYIITPTYRRPEQIPELIRMAHTLMLVENVHWLVIEDAKNATLQVTKLLNRTGLRFEHLIGTEFNYVKNKSKFLIEFMIKRR